MYKIVSLLCTLLYLSNNSVQTDQTGVLDAAQDQLTGSAQLDSHQLDLTCPHDLGITVSDEDQNLEIINQPLYIQNQLFINSTDIKRSIILQAQPTQFEVTSLSTEKDVTVFENIQASDLFLNELVSGFLKCKPAQDKLFLLKVVECKKDRELPGKNRIMQLESVIIEYRITENIKRVMITDINNACCFIASWDEQAQHLTRWEEIDPVEKESIQEALLREFWGTRKRKSRI